MADPAASQGRWVPGQLLVRIEDKSRDQVDWQALLRGEPKTGLDSLDSLMQWTGALGVEPLWPLGGQYNAFLLQFREDADIPALAALFMTNEHVEVAEPNGLWPTAVAAVRWAVVKTSEGLPAAPRSKGPR